MTRDEAENLAKLVWPKINPAGQANTGMSGVAANASNQLYNNPRYFSLTPETFVKLAVKLGMLKLEEPKSQDCRLAEAVGSSFSFDTAPHEMTIFREQLELRGLKIVEK